MQKSSFVDLKSNSALLNNKMPQNHTLPQKWPRSGVTFHFNSSFNIWTTQHIYDSARTNQPIWKLSAVLDPWCSWLHASTKKLVNLTSPVFDLFSILSSNFFQNSLWKSELFSNATKFVCLYLKTGGILVGVRPAQGPLTGALLVPSCDGGGPSLGRITLHNNTLSNIFSYVKVRQCRH